MGRHWASQSSLKRTPCGFGLALGDFGVGSWMRDVALDWVLSGGRASAMTGRKEPGRLISWFGHGMLLFRHDYGGILFLS